MTENMNDNKWVKLGLTDGMDKDKLPKLVGLYEDVAKILIGDINEDYMTVDFETVNFPITYRIVRDTNLYDNVTAEEIVTTVKNNFNRLITIVEREQKDDFPITDSTGEAVARVCEIIIENIKNKTK